MGVGMKEYLALTEIVTDQPLSEQDQAMIAGRIRGTLSTVEAIKSVHTPVEEVDNDTSRQMVPSAYACFRKHPNKQFEFVKLVYTEDAVDDFEGKRSARFEPVVVPL